MMIKFDGMLLYV